MPTYCVCGHVRDEHTTMHQVAPDFGEFEHLSEAGFCLECECEQFEPLSPARLAELDAGYD